MIREAIEKDFESFFRIKSEKDNLYWCGYNSAPDKEKLREFWKRNVPHTALRTIYMILKEEHICGYIYVDIVADPQSAKRGIELSIGVSERFSNGGLATEAIRNICELLSESQENSEIYVYIRTDNIRSQKVFTKAGFVVTEEFRVMQLQNQNEPVKLYRWNLLRQSGK